MNILKKAASFLRWRLVLVRYATRFKHVKRAAYLPRYRPSLNSSEEIRTQGFIQAEAIEKGLIDEIYALYQPRSESIIKKDRGAPFVNLIKAEDIHKDNPIMKIAFSKKIMDTVSDYYGGYSTLDSIQVLYSWPTEGALRESQMWHKDFGDKKSLHAIIYLNDVLTEDDGPFVFINKMDSTKIKPSPFVRRIKDDDFKKELGNGQIHSVYGPAGNMILMDPAVCYHYGSRCKNPRMALFVTFNSSMPFVAPQEFITKNREQLIKVACQLRPELSPLYLKEVIRG